MACIQFTFNNEPVSVEIEDPTRTLLDWLREERGLTGTKEGCNEGDCGACTVMVSQYRDGEVVHNAINSCILFLPQAHGKAVHTVEGVSGPSGQLHPVQEAMVRLHGSQCGFCTPGFIMSMVTAHANGVTGHNDSLAGNLCRCTGYAPIVRAAESAAAKPPPAWFKPKDCVQHNDLGSVLSKRMFIPHNTEQLATWYLENPDAVLIGGATDVGLWVTKQLKELDKACFVGQVAELKGILVHDRYLKLGAAVTLDQFQNAIAKRHPSLAELIRRFGSVQVRNAATVGGNIANGSPIGDLPPALVALRSELTLRKGTKQRTIPLEEFFVEYGVQDRESGEFVESVQIPIQTDHLRCYKLSKRFDQDISAVCGCFSIEVDNGTVSRARIAFGGMAATPRRAFTTEKFLSGSSWNRRTIDKACACLEEDFSPISDMRASERYRMVAAQNMLVRYFVEADQPEEPVNVLEVLL